MQPISIDLLKITPHGGSQQAAFEEFVCQLARRTDGIPTDASRFQRNGRGADLGLECIWHLPNGKKRGWQAKFVTNITALHKQASESFQRAVARHPELEEYTICFPFVPSAADGNGGTSQVARLEGYRREWEEYARKHGVSLRVKTWDASELCNRLLAIDPHGGRRRYWFDQKVLTSHWFEQQLEVALATAGPRYTPQLHVEDGVGRILAALGRTEEWDECVSQRRATLAKARADLTDSLRATHPDRSIPPFPSALLETAAELAESLARLLDALDEKLLSDHRDGLIAASRTTLDTAEKLATLLSEQLDAEHGAGASNSAAFRQHRTEYMVEFTTVHVDRAREVVTALTEIEGWLESPEVQAASTRVLLVTGAAGTGKTHAVCDETARRTARGLPSAVTFGARFGSQSAWEGIRSQLGLSADWSLDSLLDALDTAGEAARCPLLLAIDALNETTPRSFWRCELPGLIRSVLRREHIVVCLTCRSPLAASSIPDEMVLARFEHDGFAGREFDACSSFFNHYELDPPITPLLTPEFSNPLILKLTCEALVAKKMRSIPAGWRGFRDAISARLDKLDATLAQECGGAFQRAASEAVDRIVFAMAGSGTRSLEMTECLAAIGNGGPFPATNILERLIAEDVLHLIPGTGTHGLLAPPPDRVTFTYERVGDHLIAQARLRRTSPDALPSLIAESAAEPGLFEAFALQVPEQSPGTEILDLAASDVTSDLLGYWVRALEWRTPESITAATGAWLEMALGRADTFFSACEAMLALAVRPHHPLDAVWMHETLSRLPLDQRDAFWCPYLHRMYDTRAQRHGPPAVVRLVEAARNGRTVDRVADDLAVLWLTALTWFFAACDRRVRDEATRAAVRLTQPRPHVWPAVLERLASVDDDYVLERAYLACYGALLRSPEKDALALTSACAIRQIERTTNALIRDHCRAICELAHRNAALSPSIDPDEFRPPYESQWPVDVPSEPDLADYASEHRRREYPQLWSSVLSEHMGDFSCYTVPEVLRRFEHEVPLDAACRLIFQMVLDLGYSPSLHASYDWYIIQSYGNGRGRPSWADRIGKKYQWIALARATGMISDHVEPRSEFDHEPHSRSALTALQLRDLDPTTTDPAPGNEAGPCWSGLTYSPSARNGDDDAAWVADGEEMRTLEDSFWKLPCWGDKYLPLEIHPKWVDNSARPDDDHFRRQVFFHIRSYLTPCDGFEKMWRWLRAQEIDALWDLPTGRHLYEHVFLGEYPWATAVNDPPIAAAERERPNGAPQWLTPTAHLLGPELEGDCSGVGNRSVYVPQPALLDGMQWNHDGGFEASDRTLAFVDPSFRRSGIAGCFFASSWMVAWLEAQRLSLVWTIVGERIPGTYRKLGRMSYGHVRALHNGRLRSARVPKIDL